MTDRLRRRYPAFRVELVFAGLRRAARDERFLGPGAGQLMYVREVLLCRAGDPLVFAHSVTNPRALKGAWRHVARLGVKPLGAVLFRDPRVRRLPLRFRKLRPGSDLHARASLATGARLPPLWGRRSLFTSGRAALLVTEVFLPGVLAPAAGSRRW
ncbi:MAG: chorismate lyase [Burkholderiales bacterium]|nr:chorismate lyase [Burkholderiales bacterium]